MIVIFPDRELVYLYDLRWFKSSWSQVGGQPFFCFVFG
jgi:hypothetical protein